MRPDPILATLIAQRSGDLLPVYDRDPGDEDDSAAKERERMPFRLVRYRHDANDLSRLLADLRGQSNAAVLPESCELSLVWPKPASWEWRAR